MYSNCGGLMYKAIKAAKRYSFLPVYKETAALINCGYQIVTASRRIQITLIIKNLNSNLLRL
jgi:hypothetical protein